MCGVNSKSQSSSQFSSLVKREYHIQGYLMDGVATDHHHNQQQERIESPMIVGGGVHSEIGHRGGGFHELCHKLKKLSDSDPQLHCIMKEYRNDLDMYSSAGQMPKDFAHRLFEWSNRVQQHLISTNHRQQYEDRFLTVMSSDLAEECALLKKQIEKNIFKL